MEETGKRAGNQTSGFTSWPSTSFGRWSAWLLVASFVLLVLHVAVVLPLVEQRTSLEAVRIALIWVIFAGIISTGVTGAYAIVMKRERSWVVVLAVVVFLVALGFMASDVLIPG